MKASASSSASAVVEPIDPQVPVESAVVSFAGATCPAILESSMHTTGYGRFSVLACDPADEFIHIHPSEGCPFRALARQVAAYPPLGGAPTGLPFTGGWIGFLTYEAGLSIEGIPCTTVRDVPLPLARFCLYDSAAVYDHNAEQWYLTAVDWPAPIANQRPAVASRLAALRSKLASAAGTPPTEPSVTPDSSLLPVEMSREDYFTKVGRAKRYIEAGDIYQVNLTRRFSVRTDATPLMLYRRLRRSSPSSHAAFLPWGEVSILSSSPELFLDLRRGQVVTRPIKGTRPRGGDAHLDAMYRRQLEESEKERAELTMIIDLLRNDLGRVCSFGSIRVKSAGQIEEHPTVFHRVATIEGDLGPDRNWLSLLLATFPGGSITGAPKIRAMQIIDGLEPTARGVYCGSIGWIGLNGDMSLNIAIRTMVQSGDTVHVHAGGAIVADSTPEQEYDETIAKATGMLRALACEPSAERAPLEEVTIA
jgi:para-aminobenzoate synthetase component 1